MNLEEMTQAKLAEMPVPEFIEMLKVCNLSECKSITHMIDVTLADLSQTYMAIRQDLVEGKISGKRKKYQAAEQLITVGVFCGGIKAKRDYLTYYLEVAGVKTDENVEEQSS